MPDIRTALTTRISDAADDPAWDAFLVETGVAHHTQSAAWARIKSSEGWRAARVVAESRGRVVGGAQVLFRHMNAFGGVGYLSRGPVIKDGDSEVLDVVMDGLEDMVRTEGLRAVLIEPDVWPGAPLQQLAGRNIMTAHWRLSLGATVIVDLEPEPDGILATMKAKTRYNVRLAARQAITVRRGGAADLSTFHRLMEATARRQGFASAPESSYREWFDVLGPLGHIQLFIAEFGDEPVSALLAITFGKVAVYKRGAWSGRHGGRRPNEAMQWAAMSWARDAGYRWYDFDGIDARAAQHVLRDEPLPDKALRSVTRFKLGWGGRVVMLPQSVAYIPGRLARRAFAVAAPRLAGSTLAKRALRRTRSSEPPAAPM